jgi:hypothetical protein
VGSEIGQWMQHRLSRSNNSETDHPSTEQKARVSEKEEVRQMKPNSRNVVTKFYAVAVLASALMGAALNAAAAGPAPTGIKNVVLVHGAFADGSGWDAVAKILEKDGYTVSVAQPPETSYADDQKYTKGPSSAKLVTIQTLQHWYTSPPSRSMKVRAVRQSKRPCRKPPRRSSRITMEIGGSNRTISLPTSQRIFPRARLTSWPYRRCRSPPTHSPTR